MLKEVIKESPVDKFHRNQREAHQNRTFEDNYTKNIYKPSWNVGKIDLEKLK